MQEMDPEGLESCAVGIKNKKKKQCFTTRGPSWVHSVDGHNKLMGFQNDAFPLAIYHREILQKTTSCFFNGNYTKSHCQNH